MKVKVPLLLCLLTLLVFTRCAKDIDSYYDRPAWLEDPIYQELEANGNFKLYLQAVDRTLHASVLKGAGLYTCFAPNDAAFQAWMNEKGYANVAGIPQNVVDALVSYSLVYSKYEAANLGSSLVSNLWTAGLAYKYKSNYYPMLTKEEYNGDSVWVFDANIYGGYMISSKTDLSGNYKYLPVFTNSYMNSSSPALTSQDYQAFYPNSSWASDQGLGNVGPASIIGGQHLAENGLYYETDKVVDPIPNMYNVLKSDADCSEFFKLMNYKVSGGTYYYRFLSEYKSLTEQLKLIYPEKNIDKVYLRGYYGFGFDPVVESYSGEGSGSDVTQEGANTLFVPSNEAVLNFVNSKLLKYYSSLDQVPNEAITVFLASQVCESMVWPSYFTLKKNILGEYLCGLADKGPDLDAFGVTDKVMASNGIMYKINNIIKSRYFESVYTEIFLNPAYNYLNLAYSLYYTGETGTREMLMRCPLNGYKAERNTVLLFKDKLLKDDGFTYNLVDTKFNHSVLTDDAAAARMKRILNNHIFFGYVDTFDVNIAEGTYGKNTVVVKNIGADLKASDFASTGLSGYDGWNFRVTNNGEMIRFKNNVVQAIGNIEMNNSANLELVEESSNGHVFKLDRMLQYSDRSSSKALDTAYMDHSLWYYLDQARTENPNVKLFVDLVEKVMKTSTTSDALLGIKTSNFYTVLMPTNTAMSKALSAGLYPANIDNEADPAGSDKALRFLQGHFLVGQVFADDNLPIIYPFSPMSDNPTSKVCPTLLAISSDKLELTNEKTQVVAYKLKISNSYYLRFYAKNITRGNKVLVTGNPALSVGANNHLTVNRTKVTGTNNLRSNRMACKAVLHEVNNYLYFVDN
jgi:uncharacterized surface protein with fasciclin (FAS1) repeats